MRYLILTVTIMAITMSCTRSNEYSYENDSGCDQYLHKVVQAHVNSYIKDRQLKYANMRAGLNSESSNLEIWTTAPATVLARDKVDSEISNLDELRETLVMGVEDLHERLSKYTELVNHLNEHSYGPFRLGYVHTVPIIDSTGEEYGKIMAFLDSETKRVYIGKIVGTKSISDYYETWDEAYEKVYGHKPDRELP